MKRQFDHFSNELETLRYLSASCGSKPLNTGGPLEGGDWTPSPDDRAWGSEHRAEFPPHYLLGDIPNPLASVASPV